MNEPELLNELKEHRDMFDEESSLYRVFNNAHRSIENLTRSIANYKENERQVIGDLQEKSDTITALTKHNELLAANLKKWQAEVKKMKASRPLNFKSTKSGYRNEGKQ